eukprot:5211482-Amphidinium_carterae.1
MALGGLEAAPYVDMSVWGPFGHRLYKRLKLKGAKLLPDGGIGPVEMLGPPTFQDWVASWNIFKT